MENLQGRPSSSLFSSQSELMYSSSFSFLLNETKIQPHKTDSEHNIANKIKTVSYLPTSESLL